MVSVVRMACAAALPAEASSRAAASAIPFRIASMSSRRPITPVEATKTCPAGRFKVRATSRTVASASARPWRPVQALALPLFRTMAANFPPRRFRRETRTGAACTRFVVNVAATVAGPSDVTRARSSWPPCFKPQATAADRTPLTGEIPPGIPKRYASVPPTMPPHTVRQFGSSAVPTGMNTRTVERSPTETAPESTTRRARPGRPSD